jgi:hypothetical protein
VYYKFGKRLCQRLGGKTPERLGERVVEMLCEGFVEILALFIFSKKTYYIDPPEGKGVLPIVVHPISNLLCDLKPLAKKRR